MYLNLWTCTRSQSREENFSTQGHRYYIIPLIAQLGCWMLLLKITKLFWLDLYRVMLSNFMAAHNSFADSLSNFLWQHFHPVSISATALISGLTEISVWKCALLGNSLPGPPCFYVSQEWIVLEQHFLCPPSPLTLIHEDEWFSWLLVQVDSDIQRSTFFCWAGGMFQFTASFAYPSSVSSRIARFQDECIIFSPSCDNLLGQA